MASFDLAALRRRTVEIDYQHGHRHLPGSLSAIALIAEIYAGLEPRDDVFILSKGHACAAHYAVLESHGYRPDVTKVHPERHPASGIVMTSGSLGHGLPTAVGLALAKAIRREPGVVHVLLGDGETQEGTTWEALNFAARFELGNLAVHVDFNGYQGSEGLLHLPAIAHLARIFDGVVLHFTQKGDGVRMFAEHPEKSTHTVTAADYAAILAELSPPNP